MSNEHTRLAPLFQDPRLRAAFDRIERDVPGALVLPRRPEPVLPNGDAVRVLEVA